MTDEAIIDAVLTWLDLDDISPGGSLRRFPIDLVAEATRNELGVTTLTGVEKDLLLRAIVRIAKRN